MKKFVTLLVEDDVLQREVLADVLKGDGFEVVEFDGGSGRVGRRNIRN